MGQRVSRHLKIKCLIAILLAALLGIAAAAAISALKLQRTKELLFETNRARIGAVIDGLEDGVAETGNLLDEIDRVYFAKLNDACLYFGDFGGVAFDDGFAKELALFAEVDSVAVIDSAGKAYGRYGCTTDFFGDEFAPLRNIDASLTAEPLSTLREGVLTRYFARRVSLMIDRILIFAVDWTEIQDSLEGVTSREAVLRGMVSVDTYSVSVSLADKTFLYDPVGGLTGKSAEEVFPAAAFGGDFEGTVSMDGEAWCAVGREWNGEEIFVVTRLQTERGNDALLLSLVISALLLFIGLIAVYGVVLRRKAAAEGRTYGGLPLKLFIDVTAVRKLLPIFLLGVVIVFLTSYCVLTANAVSSMAYECAFNIGEAERTYEYHRDEAQFFDGVYRDSFLNKSALLVRILERNPRSLFGDVSAGSSHLLPDGSGYATSDHAFLKELCEINAIETLKVFGENGQVIASSNGEWYVPIAEGTPCWDVWKDHVDFVAEDAEAASGYAQIVCRAFFYFTKEEDGGDRYVPRSEYEVHLGDGTVAEHRGVLFLGVSPERLRAVQSSASLSYAAEHTTVHGTGSTLIFKDDEDHTCIYSPRASDIGKPAAHVGCESRVFLETGELYMDTGTVAGIEGFQAYRLVEGNYIASVVPKKTVFADRTEASLTASIAALVSFLPILLYSCLFGAGEKELFEKAGEDAPYVREEPTVTHPSGKVRKVSALWGDGERIPWRDKLPEQKFVTAAKLALLLFASAILGLIVLSRTGVLPLGAINYVADYRWTRGFNVFALTDCVMLFLFVLTAVGILKRILRLVCSNFGNRAVTLGRLFVSFVRYGSVIFAIFYGLYLCGLNAGSLLASAGILSLVIGLGAQSLIQDLLAGIFIVFEGEFRVGDIVTVDNFRGEVIDIGLRTTKVEDISRNIKIFNNSKISGLVNMTNKTSYAVVDIGIEYGESIERVEEALNREFDGIRARLPAIVDGPYYKGVQELGDSSVIIRIVAVCEEDDRIQLVRDLSREILLVFRRNGINIPFPQSTISFRKDD